MLSFSISQIWRHSPLLLCIVTRCWLTFSNNEKLIAPNAGSSSTSGLKINLKTPVNARSFTYMNKLPGKSKRRIRNVLQEMMANSISYGQLFVTVITLVFMLYGKKTVNETLHKKSSMQKQLQLKKKLQINYLHW